MKKKQLTLEEKSDNALEEMNDKISDILDKAETDMSDLIDKYNTKYEDVNYIETCDMSNLFDQLRDFVADHQ